MNRYQLAAVDTEVLMALKQDIVLELSHRRKIEKVSRRIGFVSSLKPPPMSSADDERRFNSSLPLLPPNFGQNGDGGSAARYLPALWDQDWSSVFPESEVDDGCRFYVYAHVDPEGPCVVADERCGGNFGGMPFYIGKGSGRRAYDLKRNQAHGKRIKRVLDAGFQPEHIVKIIADGLTSQKALEIESKLILLFRTEYDTPRGRLVNLDVPPRPQPAGHMVRYKSRKHWMATWKSEQREVEGA